MSLKMYFYSKEVFDDFLEKLREAREEELAEELEKESEEDFDCDCCKCCDLEDEDFDEDFNEEEDDDTKKGIVIDRSQIEDDVWEFLFFDEETSEFVWSYYGDYDYNEAKDRFLEEFDHLDVKFYLAD